MERIAPGEFCWVELATPDRAAALAFYAGLFGWSAVEQVMELAGRTFTYSLVRLGDRFVGSVYELLAEQRERGVAPHWLPYVAVESADQSVRKAEELGAACLVDPVDLLQAGRVSVLEDPSGANFAVWQGRNLLGFQVRDEPGSPCWFELVTSDVERAVGFYDALFGWGRRASKGPLDPVLLARNGHPIAGARRLPAGGDARPRWTTHFAVADCDASRERILGSGGSAEPAQAHRAGRAAAVTDVHGAPFSIVAMEARDQARD
jgi:predicted enzyme related to lactoylglutathione lyase